MTARTDDVGQTQKSRLNLDAVDSPSATLVFTTLGIALYFDGVISR